MSSSISAPTRRSVVRAAAWTAPAVSIAVAAPAYANCSLANVSGTLDWDGAGVAFSRASATSASAVYTRAGAAPLTVTVGAAYTGAMRSGPEFTGTNTSMQRQSVVGGLPIGGLRFEQSTTSRNPQGRNDRGTYTLTFDRAVKNLSFYITDIDSASGDFRDAVELPSGFSRIASGSSSQVIGTGTATNPYNINGGNVGVDNSVQGGGNLRVTNAGPLTSFTINFWNIAAAYDRRTDTNQVIFISDLTFDYAPQAGCAAQ